MQRNARETLQRLGYGAVSLRQLGVVVLFVGVALALSYAADTLFAQLQPDLYRKVGEISSKLFSPTGLSPASAVLFALLVGVGAGLGEETLFRGGAAEAGILADRALRLHALHGPRLLGCHSCSIGSGSRADINTTASFLAHATYNTLGILLAYFLG